MDEATGCIPQLMAAMFVASSGGWLVPPHIHVRQVVTLLLLSEIDLRSCD